MRPNVAPDELRGVRHARLASFGTVQTTIGEAGMGFVTLAVADRPDEWEPGSDAAAVAGGYASVAALTPLCASDILQELELDRRFAAAASPPRMPTSVARWMHRR